MDKLQIEIDVELRDRASQIAAGRGISIEVLTASALRALVDQVELDVMRARNRDLPPWEQFENRQ